MHRGCGQREPAPKAQHPRPQIIRFTCAQLEVSQPLEQRLGCQLGARADGYRDGDGVIAAWMPPLGHL